MRTTGDAVRCGAAIAVLIFSPGAAWGDGPGVEGTPSTPIHQLELERYNAAGAAAPTNPPLPTLRSEPGGQPRREVHGYHPYWLGAAYERYDWSLLSTVAFFALELSSFGEITGAHGWPWHGLVAAAHAGSTRVVVTATQFSPAELTVLLGSARHRAAAVQNLVDAVREGGADGVSIDFEGVPGSQKANLVTFAGELRAALDDAIDDAYLSIATPAVDWANAFDYDELAARADHLVVLAYNYRWSGSETTGPVAPVVGWGPHNVTWTVQDYVRWGAPRDRLLLGVPYFGYRWPAVTDLAGALTRGAGTARTFAQARGEAAAHRLRREPSSGSPWYAYDSGGWVQGWFDDATSLAAKYALVADQQLAGIGVWALGYDGNRPELAAALREAFGAAVPEPEPVAAPRAPAIVSVRPNPFNPATRVVLSVPEAGLVRLVAHDARGRWVATVADREFEVGDHAVVWTPVGLPSGVYWLSVPGTASRARAVLVR